MSKIYLRFIAMKILVATIFVTVSCKARTSESSLKVVNGIEISKNQYPSTVLLWVDRGSGEKTCSGVFVNDHQILTSAHCLEGLSTSHPEKIKFVEVDENGKSALGLPIFPAKHFTVHSDYGKKSPEWDDADIALVTFAANAGLHFSSVVLASQVESGNTVCIQIGFGEGGMGKRSSIKRMASYEISRFGSNLIVAKSIVRGNFGYKLGPGDSGGPLMCDGKIAGITKSQIEDDNHHFRIYFIDLGAAKIREFLRQNIEASSQPLTGDQLQEELRKRNSPMSDHHEGTSL